LLRNPGDTPGNAHVLVAYDALAGYLVADTILARHGRTGLEEWLKAPGTVTMLSGPTHDRHPLATDRFRALVGLVPRRLHRQQLWTLLDEPLRTSALIGAAELEGAYLDAQTVEQLAALVLLPTTGARDLLDRLWHTHSSPAHPLNAEFLDTVLRPMEVAKRDLRWTEWIRRHSEYLLDDLHLLEQRWCSTRQPNPGGLLRARWVMWMLTSTVRELRDQATRTLYWFGRGDPAALFNLTLDSLAINDPYVSERLLASSYGVAMAYHFPEQEFSNALAKYLEGLRDALTGSTAAYPTSHWLGRLYVQGTVTLALTYHRDAVPEGLVIDGRVQFTPGPNVEPVTSDDPRASEVAQTLHMDFKNYTLGRLFPGRLSYDMEHHGHQAAVAHVLGTVWALGWRKSGLGAVDEHLTSYASRGRLPLVERYGKKYGWIGFYTYAGMLEDLLPQGRSERLWDIPIDPSFLEPPSSAAIDLPIWARPTPADDRRWIRQGIITIPDQLLYSATIEPHQGTWVAVSGYLTAENQTPGRRVFGILTALLLATEDSDRLVEALKTWGRSSRWQLPDEPSNYRIFAGEIPWSPEFAGEGTEYSKRVRVDDGSPIEVEILAHRYTWDERSGVNEVLRALVPSRTFSTAFDLRGVQHSFDQALPDGTIAAISLSAPAGFHGELSYLREDLVHRYASGRQLVWFIWGERQIYPPYPHPEPDWLIKAWQSSTDVWRHIRRGNELSSASPRLRG
jgi:hypothetical protein